MVEGFVAILILIPFKQRIINDPQEIVPSFVNEVQFASEVEAKITECIGDDFRSVSDKEHDVARFRARSLLRCFKLLCCEKLDNTRRPFRFFLAVCRDFDPRQPFRSVGGDELGQIVDVFA